MYRAGEKKFRKKGEPFILRSLRSRPGVYAPRLANAFHFFFQTRIQSISKSSG